ncbi:hypothetical protein ACOI22_13655 [Glaciecola sp. 2405UD65-10]|uniref:hypothetical protein n=1 Tax=Glaciecola sp. 2405UD65-10 TaxID=3397244 RepID=UPI003B5C5203
MKLFFALILTSNFAFSTEVIPTIECGEYRADPHPAKMTFDLALESKLSFDYPSFFHKVKHLPESEPQWLYELIDLTTYKYKKTFPNSQKRNEAGKTPIEELTIQPSFAVRFEKSVIAGFNNGEFGGEIVRIDENGNVTLIKNMNIEDIYVIEGGLLIVSGIAHLSTNKGILYLLDKEFELHKYYGLIGAPVSSWLLNDGSILINSYDSGSQVFNNDYTLQRVSCG